LATVFKFFDLIFCITLYYIDVKTDGEHTNVQDFKTNFYTLYTFTTLYIHYLPSYSGWNLQSELFI